MATSFVRILTFEGPTQIVFQLRNLPLKEPSFSPTPLSKLPTLSAFGIRPTISGSRTCKSAV